MKDILRKALERSKMSQKELAERIHVTPQAVSKWLNGESRPTLDNIVEIRNVLGINLTEETIIKQSRKGRGTMERKYTELKDLDNIDKAREEARLILKEVCIDTNYPYHIYILLEWIVTATIGLVYHKMLNPIKSHGEHEYGYGDIFCELEDFFQEKTEYDGRYPNELAYSFYLMGGDLFESWGEYRLKNHDYARDAMNIWYDFLRVFGDDLELPIPVEFKIGLIEIINTYITPW